MISAAVGDLVDVNVVNSSCFKAAQQAVNTTLTRKVGMRLKGRLLMDLVSADMPVTT